MCWQKIFSGNRKIILFLAIVMAASFAVRFYNFNDWLFFKMDQARDANLISKIYEGGPGELPLLGPKAGGTFLRLGPVFYYFQYLSTEIFQSTNPEVFAYPDLLFSILAIPLFFFFLRKYFSLKLSMVLTILFSFSFLAVEYSRFAWNPNSLPFFNLLFFYALLEIFDSQKRKKILWAVIAGLSFAISTQLHFLSLVTLPFITLFFFAVKWKTIKEKINWKMALIFLGIVVLFYVPMIFSELITKFDNVHQFFSSIGLKSSDDHSLPKKIIRDAYYFGYYYLIIWTGSVGKRNLLIFASQFAIGLSLAANLFLLRKEKDEGKKNFLWLSFLWFVIYSITYIPIAYSIRPRFFLPMLELPFIFLGYAACLISGNIIFSRFLKLRKVIATGLLGACFLANGYGIFSWFREMRDSQEKMTEKPRKTIILRGIDGITLWHIKKVSEFIISNCKEENIHILISGAELKAPINYVLAQMGNSKSVSFKKIIPENSCHYAVKTTRGSIPKYAKDDFIAEKTHEFGDISIVELGVKNPEKITSDGAQVQEEIYVEDSADNQGDAGPEDASNDTDDEDVRLAKQPRYFWKDVFKKFF